MQLHIRITNSLVSLLGKKKETTFIRLTILEFSFSIFFLSTILVGISFCLFGIIFLLFDYLSWYYPLFM